MKHVIKEGQKSLAKNIVNYTKQAKAFFANNITSGYLLCEGVIKLTMLREEYSIQTG